MEEVEDGREGSPGPGTYLRLVAELGLIAALLSDRTLGIRNIVTQNQTSTVYVNRYRIVCPIWSQELKLRALFSEPYLLSSQPWSTMRKALKRSISRGGIGGSLPV